MSNMMFVKFRPFDKIETNWICSLFRLCRKDETLFDKVAKKATMSKQRSTFLKKHSTLWKIVRLVALDNVASTLFAGVDVALRCSTRYMGNFYTFYFTQLTLT